jgi:hypothetical protein
MALGSAIGAAQQMGGFPLGGGVDLTPITTAPGTIDDTAKAIKGDDLIEASTLSLRQGQVVTVNVVADTVDITLGGDPTVIKNVKKISNYRATVNDVVFVLVNGPDLFVLDRIGAFGPSVISTAATNVVSAVESRSSATFGNLTTVGPTLSVNISPSGRLLLGVCCACTSNVSGEGGIMGFFLSGANTTTGVNGWEAFFNYTGTINSYVSATKVSLLTGMTPGTTQIQAKYCNINGLGSVSFAGRALWAVPL